MKATVLIFPDVASIFEFIMEDKISNVEVSDLTLTAILTDEQIVLACTKYKALPIKTKSISAIELYQ